MISKISSHFKTLIPTLLLLAMPSLALADASTVAASSSVRASGLVEGWHPPMLVPNPDPSNPCCVECEPHRLLVAVPLIVREPSASATINRNYALRHSLHGTLAAADAAAYRQATKWGRQTAYVQPRQDKFGDPMYVGYGHRAYAGTPCYNGPSYAASFDTEYPGPSTKVHRGSNRAYNREAFSNPRYAPRTDTGLGVGATHSFIQSGMNRAPGLWAVSAARPADLNRP